MLVKVKDLDCDMKNEFIRIVQEYKSKKRHREALPPVFIKEHLLSDELYTSWDEMNDARTKALPDVEFHEYAAIHNGLIIGLFHFSTTNVDGKIHGDDWWVLRNCSTQHLYHFGKSWHLMEQLYFDTCHVVSMLVIISDDKRQFINNRGDLFVWRHAQGGELKYSKIINRLGEERECMTLFKKGNLCS